MSEGLGEQAPLGSLHHVTSPLNGCKCTDVKKSALISCSLFTFNYLIFEGVHGRERPNTRSTVASPIIDTQSAASWSNTVNKRPPRDQMLLILRTFTCVDFSQARIPHADLLKKQLIAWCSAHSQRHSPPQESSLANICPYRSTQTPLSPSHSVKAKTRSS